MDAKVCNDRIAVNGGAVRSSKKEKTDTPHPGAPRGEMETPPLPNAVSAADDKDRKGEAQEMLGWLYRLGRDPSLHTKSKQPFRESLKRLRHKNFLDARQALRPRLRSDAGLGNGPFEDSHGSSEEDTTTRRPKPRRAAAPRNLAERPTRRRRRKAKPRASSPADFPSDPAAESSYGPRFMQAMPARVIADASMRVISKLYYTPTTLVENGDIEGGMVSGKVRTYGTMETLLAPIRRPRPIDTWSSQEVALFEAGICEFGEDLEAVAKLIPQKSTSEVVQFYYSVWRFSRRELAYQCHQAPESERASIIADFSKTRAAAARALKRDVLAHKSKRSRSCTSGVGAIKPKRRKRRHRM